jgi:glycosyltransferase involved in cell wall biosynthesis
VPMTLAGRSIALVSRIYLPEPAAASFRLGALARTLRDAGAKVRVLTSTAPRGYDDVLVDHDGIEVRRAGVLRDRAGYVRGYAQYLSFDIPAFFRVLFSRGIGAVVVEPPPTTAFVVRIACGIRRIPYFYYAADIWADALATTKAPGFVARAVRVIERWAMRGAAAVLSTSEESSARLAELRSSERIVTIGNGVDTGLFGPDGDARVLDAPYLLYAGTASEVHGATIFLEAATLLHDEMPDLRIVFVGHGAERARLGDLAAGLGEGTVRFEPRLSAAETARWIRGARATLASVRPDGYHRAFPTKMYASVACGTRVIYAGIGPGRDFARSSQLGWAVDYEPHAVAGAMRAALASPATPAARKALARWAEENVSLQAVAARAVDAIGDLLAGRRTRRASSTRK